MTGLGAVFNTARVEPGGDRRGHRLRGVGIAAIQGARVSGAAVIVGVDTVASKHDAALAFGATHAVHPDQLAELSAQLTGGEGFDYAFEVVGTPQTIRAAWTAARRGGTVVVVGALLAPTSRSNSPRSSCSSTARGFSARSTARRTCGATTPGC